MLEYSIQGALHPRVCIHSDHQIFSIEPPVEFFKEKGSIDLFWEYIGEIQADNAPHPVEVESCPFSIDHMLLRPTKNTLATLISFLESGMPSEFSGQPCVKTALREIYDTTYGFALNEDTSISIEDEIKVYASAAVSSIFDESHHDAKCRTPLIFVLSELKTFAESHEKSNLPKGDSPQILSINQKREYVFKDWSFGKDLDENDKFNFTKRDAWEQLGRIDKRLFPPCSDETIKGFFEIAAPNKFKRGRPRGK